MRPPCQGCPDRHELCHMECPKYLEYRAERDRLREEREFMSVIVWSSDSKQRATRRKLNDKKRRP